jgi:HD-GYP domain-containing protein (c-di-GMP phosphodiesterase class II)
MGKPMPELLLLAYLAPRILPVHSEHQDKDSTRLDSRTAASIKKISVDELKPGMFIHDLNCGWMDHPFLTNRFPVKDEQTVDKIRGEGIREIYIDTSRGLDVAHAPTADEVQQEIRVELDRIAEEAPAFKTASLEEELHRAHSLKQEANQITRDLLRDIRLGKQVELERVEPMVEHMIDSIFRNQDALLPLLRLKEHDNYTFQHSVSVSALLVTFARGLDFSQQQIKEIAMGGLLHDVGKAKVPDAILNKPAKLSDAEFLKMKSHVVQSIILLQHTPRVCQTALEVAGQHHERYDGTGYPNKLKGDEISQHGQMGAIVDVYDALTSERVYKKGMLPTTALGKLLEWSKFHFHPDLVRTYIRSVGIYPTGSLVKLVSGRLAVVVEQSPDHSLQPKVRAIYNSKRQQYISPEDIDLAHPRCQDQIAGHESFEQWGIDPRKWVGQLVLAA